VIGGAALSIFSGLSGLLALSALPAGRGSRPLVRPDPWRASRIRPCSAS